MAEGEEMKADFSSVFASQIIKGTTMAFEPQFLYSFRAAIYYTITYATKEFMKLLKKERKKKNLKGNMRINEEKITPNKGKESE